MEIGKFYEMEVVKKVDFGVYLQSERGEILLPQKYTPEEVEIGDYLRVFVHKDSEDRLLATTLQPKGQLNEFVSLIVKDTNPHGAFLDWGLEKDLFVPHREQHIPFKIGHNYIVRICLDHKSDRLIGVGKIKSFLSNRDLGDLREGDPVELLIYSKTEIGYNAVVNQKHEGLIYHNEIFESIHIGDIKSGYIKKIREDGKLDLTLSAAGQEAIDTNKDRILQSLKENDGFLALHDQSTPEEILQELQMSKKAFKKAIGGLYKSQLIDFDDNGIRLL